MVEFGLKLQDNQVAEWSNYYIQYEKLKQILKKCAAARLRYHHVAQHNPRLAAAVALDFEGGLPTPQASVPDQLGQASSHEESSSLLARPSLSQLRATDVLGAPESFARAPAAPVSTDAKIPSLVREPWLHRPTGDGSTLSTASERTPLRVPTTTTLYRAQTERRSGRRLGPADLPSSTESNPLVRVLERATTGFTEYFSTQRSYERQLWDILKEYDRYTKEFDECLSWNVALVNGFYTERLEELEERLSLLKESVAHSRSSPNLGPLPPQHHHHHHHPPREGPLGAQEAPTFTVQDLEEDEDEDEDDDDDEHNHHGLKSLPNHPHDPHHTGRGLAHAMARLSMRISNSVGSFTLLGTEEEELDQAAADRKVREATSIQRALVDQYRTAKLLYNFAIMNHTGFVKIVKKHDKMLPERAGRYKQTTKEENICHEGKNVESLADRMEHLYARWFCDGKVSEAQAQMLPKRGDALEMDWSQLRLGYRMGMCTVLGMWVAWDCIWGLLSVGVSTIGQRTAFPVFRACAGLLLLQWCWACSAWVWTRYRINYIFLFDLNPRIVASPLALFNEAVDNTLVFMACMLLYYKAGAHQLPWPVPVGVFPLFLVLYTCFHLLFPFRTRGPMWRTITEVATAPLTSPTFYHGYVGDIFTSMVKVFQDIAWTFFFIWSGDWLISEDLPDSDMHSWSKSTWYSHVLIPLLTLLPLWFRFNQCLRRYAETGDRVPHLANAFKYALSQTVTLFGAFHPLYMNHYGSLKNHGFEMNLFQGFWISAFISSSLYSFVWDVVMDWGLGRPQHAFLAARLMYPKRKAYYAIIGLDLVLRFAWVLTLVPPQSGAAFALPQYLTAVSMMLELFRRTMWGFLRLENEHRSNASGFRRVGFVPLHFSTGHMHEYKKQKELRGVSVLLEVAVVTLLVLGAAVISVVAAQRATEKSLEL